MQGLTSQELQEAARKLREAEAGGKILNAAARSIIAEAEAERAELEALAMRTAGRGKLVGALYILGASLSQMADRFKINRATVWNYVRSHVPEKIRLLAKQQRDGTDWTRQRLLSGEMMEKYIDLFAEHKVALYHMNSVGIAAKLNAIEPARPTEVESMEDADGEPY